MKPTGPSANMTTTMNLESERPLLISGPKRSHATLVLAHGAGAPMDSEFMNLVAAGVAEHGIQVVRFEFPYMATRRRTGKKRPPDREPVLRQTWLDVIDSLGRPDRMVIGGKSMGGRIASLIADEARVAGLVCLGYPFHPTGKPEKLRTEHLKSLATPALILQGERDPFGKRDEVRGYGLPRRLKIAWLPDGDHSLKPRKASGRTLQDNLAVAVAQVAAFVNGLTSSV